MMIYPPIADLVKKAGSRYALVIEAAKRARQLSQGAEPLSKADSNKEVVIAASEIFEGKISAVMPDQIQPHSDVINAAELSEAEMSLEDEEETAE